MTNRRAKAAATATVLGLGALGGIALGSNPGMPAASQQSAGSAAAAVVTGASGAAAVTGQTVAIHRTAGSRAPIVTRASGAGGLGAAPQDD